MRVTNHHIHSSTGQTYPCAQNINAKPYATQATFQLPTEIKPKPHHVASPFLGDCPPADRPPAMRGLPVALSTIGTCDGRGRTGS